MECSGTLLDCFLSTRSDLLRINPFYTEFILMSCCIQTFQLIVNFNILLFTFIFYTRDQSQLMFLYLMFDNMYWGPRVEVP
jgi:hypothetical protein